MSLPKDPEKLAGYLKKLSDAKIGKPPHNKGKTLTELYNPDKAAEISKKHADSAKETKNRTGRKATEQTKKNISLGRKGQRSSRKGKTNIEMMGEERAAELSSRMSEFWKGNSNFSEFNKNR